LSPNGQSWIERVHCALHDNRNVTPATLAQRFFIERRQVNAVKHDLSTGL
jgi:hypothetical protein